MKTAQNELQTSLGGLVPESTRNIEDLARVVNDLQAQLDLIYAAIGHNHNSDYAPIAKGVTNGDGHDHNGGDGAQIPTGGIANDAVTNALLANVATATFKGRTTAGTGDPEDLTVAQAKALLAMQTGESVLGSSFSITGTAGTFQDTGLSITLPSAGTYLIIANIRGVLTGNAGTAWWIESKLYNSTDAADVANSERMTIYANTAALGNQNTSILSAIVTVTAAKTIKLYAARNGAGSPSWTASQIASASNGRTTLSYVEITK